MSPNGGTILKTSSALRDTVQLITTIALAVLLPTFGYFANEVLNNGRNIAVLYERVDEHTKRGTHADSVHKDTLDRALEALNANQTTRDTALRRELEAIKEELKRIERPK